MVRRGQLSTRGAREFVAEGDAGSDSCRQSRGEAKRNAESDAEEHAVRDATRNGAERAVFPAEQIVGQIQAAEQIERSSSYADPGKSVVVHLV
jgi:hypothetical protein